VASLTILQTNVREKAPPPQHQDPLNRNWVGYTADLDAVQKIKIFSPRWQSHRYSSRVQPVVQSLYLLSYRS